MTAFIIQLCQLQYYHLNYWNNKENCIVEAKKYNTITELQKHCYGCYMGLKRNDWLYEVFPLKNKAVGYWNNLDNLIKEASKYKTKKDRISLIG